MAVTIIDRRVVITDAEDDTVGWTPGGGGVTSTDVAEATNAVIESIAIGNAANYFTAGASIDCTDTLIYVYTFNNALQNPWDNTIPPQGLLIGDGTNIIAFHMAGGDRRVFNHLDGPTSWQNLVLDTSQAAIMDAAGLSYAAGGNFGALNIAALVDFGNYFETLSKALGGGYNVATDIIRYGNKGLWVVGGTAGDPGTFTQLALADASILDQAGHGICRAYTTIAFGVQGSLTFGKQTETPQDSYFSDLGIVIAFEDRNISNDKYFFNIEGAAGSTTEFSLVNTTITTANQWVSVSAGQNIDVLNFNTVSFVDLKRDVWLPEDSAGNTHSVDGCSFIGGKNVSAGTVPIINTSFSSSTSAASGALVWNDNISISDCAFNNNTGDITYGRTDGEFFRDGIGPARSGDTKYPSGFGIRHDTAGTYNYVGLTFDNNDADIYFTGRGTLTINADPASDPTTYRVDHDDAIVDIVQSATLTLTNVVASGNSLIQDSRNLEGSEVRIYTTGTQTEQAGIENVIVTDGDEFGTFEWTYNAPTVPNVDIVIHHVEFEYFRVDNFEPAATNASLPIAQQYDRNYSNP